MTIWLFFSVFWVSIVVTQVLNTLRIEKSDKMISCPHPTIICFYLNKSYVKMHTMVNSITC